MSSEYACSHMEAYTKSYIFANRIFKSVSLNENVWIFIRISLKYVVLVQPGVQFQIPLSIAIASAIIVLQDHIEHD